MATQDTEKSRGEQAVGIVTGSTLCFLTILLLNHYAFHHTWPGAATDALALALIYVVANIIGIAVEARRSGSQRRE